MESQATFLERSPSLPYVGETEEKQELLFPASQKAEIISSDFFATMTVVDFAVCIALLANFQITALLALTLAVSVPTLLLFINFAHQNFLPHTEQNQDRPGIMRQGSDWELNEIMSPRDGGSPTGTSAQHSEADSPPETTPKGSPEHSDGED